MTISWNFSFEMIIRNSKGSKRQEMPDYLADEEEDQLPIHLKTTIEIGALLNLPAVMG